jgi:hypothetical protein
MAIEITGSGNVMFSKCQFLGIAERITGEALLETQHRADVTGADFGNILAVVGMHTDQATDALFLPLVEF